MNCPATPHKIAIVGGGIAGLAAARTLAARNCRVTLFEAGDYIGGHTNTIDVETAEGTWAVDTGFIVHNRKTYPHFIKLLEDLNVETIESEMSFSVACERSGLEYSGHDLNHMRDIMRLHKIAPEYLANASAGETVTEFLSRYGFSKVFRDRYFVPITASIWSALPGSVLDFPAKFILGFLHNHGMLQVDDRPIWRVIKGGSREYVKALLAELPENCEVRKSSPVGKVERTGDGVVLTLADEQQTFDYAILACHSDQALKLLNGAATRAEKEVLGAIPYQRNEAILHTDESVLPTTRMTWSSWNYLMPRNPQRPVVLTYNMNVLQRLDAPHVFSVTLNDDGRINPNKIIRRIDYAHPVFLPKAVSAQARHREINGADRLYFAGAYWRHGFHEDGMWSALQACDHLFADVPSLTPLEPVS
jgi:predicted NAD/FAD-binding protein